MNLLTNDGGNNTLMLVETSTQIENVNANHQQRNSCKPHEILCLEQNDQDLHAWGLDSKKVPQLMCILLFSDMEALLEMTMLLIDDGDIYITVEQVLVLD